MRTSAVYWLTLCLAIVACTGCQSAKALRPVPVLAATQAPTMPLRLASYSHGKRDSAIRFSDLRPDYERHYYPGTTEPQRWKDAVSMVPQEAFDPPLTEQIRDRLESRGSVRNGNVRDVQIELTSFQFVFDRRDDVQGEFDAKFNNWKTGVARTDEETEAASSEDDEGTESIGAELLGFAFRSVFIHLPRSIRRSKRVRREFTVPEQSTPTGITLGKQAGLNCQLNAVVTLTDHQGESTRKVIEVLRHSPFTDEDSIQDQAAIIVESAVDDFCQQVEEL